MERQATVGRRTGALTRATAAMRECLAAIAETSDLSALLAEVLKAAVERLEAAGGSIWLVDDGDIARLALVHDGQRVVEGSDIERDGRLSHATTRAPELRSNRIVVEPLWPFEESPQSEEPGYRTYLRLQGFKSAAIVPLFVGKAYQGSMALRFREERELSAEEEELAYLLANQAALAIQVNRLAEAARDAAVAREREAVERGRADAMARANTVLRSLLQRLAERPDLGAFLGEALTICAHELGAVGAAIWIRLAPGEHGLLISSEVGEIRTASDYIMRVQRLTDVERKLARGQIAFTTSADYKDPDVDWDPSYLAYIQARRVVALANVPMFVGDRWIGTVSFSHTEQEPDYTPERRELALALGNQIALALELQRLADSARDAALSEERATAARERTEAVERTAETLRLSLDLLAAEPELERFLGHVLRAANTRLNVRRSTLWLHDPDLGVNRLHMACHKGRISVDPVDASGQPVLAPPRDSRAWRRLVEDRMPIAFDDAPNNPEIPEIHEAMRSLGVRSLLIVPLMLAAEILGVIGLYNTERESWTEDEINLAKALGHQATLALQLTRLATRAREGAILEERNRLAREIHDTLAQGFAAIRMQLELARGDPDMPSKAAEALELAHQIAGENLVEARRSMAVLKSARPTLGASLSAAIEGVRRLGQTRVVSHIGAAPEPPPDVAHELLRIGQEAMLNAMRHAEASTLRITLAGVPGGGVQIAVTDDGKGFDPAHIGKGFGLAGLRERATAINAELTIVSEPGGGTEVIATWAPA